MTAPASALFGGTADWYARYRPPYPCGLLGLIRTHYDAQLGGRLLDLGCGTGHLLLPLAGDFREAVGIDPEAEMIAAARQGAAARGIGNATYRVMPAEAIDAALGRFDLVVCGNALHWMDQTRVLRLCHERLNPAGGMVVIASGGFWSGAEAWQQTVVRVIRRWLGEARRAGAGHYTPPPQPHQDYIRESDFRLEDSGEYRVAYRWTIETIIGCLYSTSFCRRDLLGDRAPGFEADLRAALLELQPDGEFTEVIEYSYWFLRR